MTFDEFFKKKRIDLTALQQAEPVLFSEFKAHFEQMGEKSFDHTKKYWFNKIRRQFPLAAEVKTDKPHIANPIAEQTITESLTDIASATQSPKVGFVPRFKAPGIPTSAVDDRKEGVPPDTHITGSPAPVEPAASKPAGFVPRFKMKPATGPESSLAGNDEPVNPVAETPPKAQPTPPADPASKPSGFTPRFKMNPKGQQAEPGAEFPAVPDIVAKPEAETGSEAQSNPAASKPAGFTPRFKMKPKAEPAQSGTENPVEPAASSKPGNETNTETTLPETPAKKPAYKPRFVPPKPKEE